MRYTPEVLPDRFSFRICLLNEKKARTITIVELYDTHGEMVSMGHAICSPQDEFNAQRGILIAEGRALKAWYQLTERKKELGHGYPVINSNA